MRKTLLFAEFALLFLGAPLLLFFEIVNIFEIFLLLFASFIPLVYIVLHFKEFRRTFTKIPTKEQLKDVVLRFFILGVVMILFVYIFFNDLLFYLPLEKPLLFTAIFFLYPFLSALPQELAFRLFFFKRYDAIFGEKYMIFTINVIAFAYMHIVFGNIYAIIFSLIGGYIFAGTYRKSGSFLLVWFEHMLYGWLIFSSGMGNFFHL